jgi:hypothetical protein
MSNMWGGALGATTSLVFMVNILASMPAAVVATALCPGLPGTRPFTIWLCQALPGTGSCPPRTSSWRRRSRSHCNRDWLPNSNLPAAQLATRRLEARPATLELVGLLEFVAPSDDAFASCLGVAGVSLLVLHEAGATSGNLIPTRSCCAGAPSPGDRVRPIEAANFNWRPGNSQGVN